ncbi:hypothetical protein Aab01nite_20650 [Paractinoplanes abujensis]|nr:hypothetical protein Aab01nite_20650 [Actinoplanes abujensis]
MQAGVEGSPRAVRKPPTAVFVGHVPGSSGAVEFAQVWSVSVAADRSDAGAPCRLAAGEDRHVQPPPDCTGPLHAA